MLRFFKMTMFVIAFIACISTTYAQTPADSTARARIGFLAGSFVTATHMPPMGKMKNGIDGKGTSVITWMLDSMFLSIDDENSNALLGHYKAHGMLGYDAIIHQYVLTMYNNFGDHPSYQGNFVGDTLVLQTKIAAPQGSFDQQIRWYKDGDAVKLSILNDAGKGFKPTLDQTATPASKK